MVPIGRVLIVAGIILIVLGVILSYGGLFSSLRLGRLPGDISIKRENFSFYFPIVTCLLVSLILTLVLYFLRK